jgi:hypothetical protein
MVFEIEKQFEKTEWSAARNKKYLFDIKFTGDGPKITSIRVKDEDYAKTPVELLFIDNTQRKNDEVASRPITDVVSRIIIDFDEDINDRELTDKTNAQGKIKLGLVANRARIYIDTVYGINGLKYSIPAEWRTQATQANRQQFGKRVNQQPAGGFTIPLKPYLWSGWSITPLIYAGFMIQSANNLINFSENSQFFNEKAFKMGAGLDVAYFFNPENGKDNSRNWLYGVGSGFSVSYFKSCTNSEGFQQNPYAWSDQAGDTCQVLISGTTFDESIETFALSIPVYFELKKRLKHRILSMRAFSIQAGVNLLFPVISTYETEGVFSRHGLYPEYNNQTITDDPYYNYYTNVEKEYSGQVDYRPLIAEGLIKLNGCFDIFNNSDDNTVNVGLQFSFPFTSPTNSNPDDYYMSLGNDEYSSLAYSRKNIYEYYFGISVGINLVNYKEAD